MDDRPSLIDERPILVDTWCTGCVISVRPFEWSVEIDADWDQTIQHVQVELVSPSAVLWERRWRRRFRRAWDALRCRNLSLGFELMHPKAIDDLIKALRRAKKQAWQGEVPRLLG